MRNCAVLLAMCGALVLGMASMAPAADLYWDTNGPTTGAGGPTPTGTWDAATTANWNTNSGGTGATQTFAGKNRAFFAAGTDATGSYTVTVNGTVGIQKQGNSVNVQEGNVTLSGGTIGAAGGDWNQNFDWVVGPGSTLTVNSTLGNTGGGGSHEKLGDGTMIINGTDGRQANFIVSAGTLLYNTTSHTNKSMGVNNGGTLGGTGTIKKTTTVNSGGKLAPGTSLGTLTFDDSLNISGALGGPAGSMLFDLGPNPSGDMVTLTGNNLLTIGSGLLNWDDFVFTDLGAIAGDYTLFDTGRAISGTLGTSLTGTVGSLEGTLAFGDSGQDLVLTLASGVVIPEPSALLIWVLGLLGLVLCARQRRR